jgi:hypothetical protein
VTPRGEINGGVLDIVIKQPGQVKAEDVEKELKSALEGIKFYLDAQRTQINSELAQLPTQIRGAIAKRRARNSEIANLSAALGIRGAPKPATPAPAKTTVSKATPKPVREVEWDVFISHASGDKDEFVRPLANALKARGLLKRPAAGRAGELPQASEGVLCFCRVQSAWYADRGAAPW